MRCTAAPKVTLAIWLNKKSALHAVVLDGDGDTYDRVTRCIKRKKRRRRRRRHNHCNSISQEKRRKLSSFVAKNPSPHSFCSINLADKSRIRVGRLCVLSWRKMSETAAAAQPVKSQWWKEICISLHEFRTSYVAKRSKYQATSWTPSQS